MTNLKIIKSDEIGKSTAAMFDDYEIGKAAGVIEGLQIRYGKIVDCIEVTYAGSVIKHGRESEGKPSDYIDLTNDRIVSISGVYDADWDGHKNIAQMTLETDSGAKYGPYGWAVDGRSFHLDMRNTNLLAFFGSTGGPSGPPGGIASFGIYSTQRQPVEPQLEQMFQALPTIPTSSDIGVWEYARKICMGRIAREALCMANGIFAEMLHTAYYHAMNYDLYAEEVFRNMPSSGETISIAWKQGAIAMTCCGIMQFNKSTSSLVNRDAVNNSLRTLNSQFKSYSYDLYQKAFCHFFHDFSTVYEHLALKEKEYYLNSYKDHILSGAFINAKKQQLVDGTWTQPSWEMFHHWLKLKSLGCTDVDLAAIIGTLQNEGIVMQDVTFDKIYKYNAYYIDQPITATDFCPHMERAMNLNQCPFFNRYHHFVTQTASMFYQQPHSSCFTGNTLVRMANGQLKEIQTIQAGDRVLSADNSSRQVMEKVRTIGKHRNLYKVNGLDFQFTGTHPFLNPARVMESDLQAPKYLCTDRDMLAEGLVGFERYGIANLDKGASLISHRNGIIGKSEVASIAVEETDQYEMPLFDLIVEPDSRNDKSFFVGDKTQQFAVVSEVPLYEDFIIGAATVNQFMSNVKAALIQLLQERDSEGVYSSLLERISPALAQSFDYSIKKAGDLARVDSVFDSPLTLDTLLASYVELLGIASSDAPLEITSSKSLKNSLGIDPVMDHFFELLQFQSGNQICDAIAMGYRIFPSVIALDIHRITWMHPGDPTIEIKLPEIGASLSAHCTAGEFISFVHDTIYLDKSYQFSIGKQSLHIEVWRGGHILYKATLPGLCPMEGAEYDETNLFDNDNRLAGRMGYSVRALTEQQKSLELEKKAQWDQEQQKQYSARFASLASDAFLQNISEQ